jgi:hypothetical protein
VLDTPPHRWAPSSTTWWRWCFDPVESVISDAKSVARKDQYVSLSRPLNFPRLKLRGVGYLASDGNERWHQFQVLIGCSRVLVMRTTVQVDTRRKERPRCERSVLLLLAPSNDHRRLVRAKLHPEQFPSRDLHFRICSASVILYNQPRFVVCDWSSDPLPHNLGGAEPMSRCGEVRSKSTCSYSVSYRTT